MKYLLTYLLFISSGFIAAQPTSFASRGIGGGGAMFAMSVNPADNDEYYAACDMGELFHTFNFGESYNQVHFNQLKSSIKSKVCFTNIPGLLYSIACPTNYFPVPVKSTDNGITWKKLTGSPNPNDYDRAWITCSVNADFNNPQRVIISHPNIIYFSGNGGTSFRNIHSAINPTVGIVVGGVLFNGENIYIGTNDGVLVSTNGGTTWVTANIPGIPSAERIWSFAAAKADSITRFFCITANEKDISCNKDITENVNFAKGVYSVDYSRGNWTPKMTGIDMAKNYLMFIDMAENNISTVYIAAALSSYVPLMLKTTNAGTNWNNVLITSGNKNIITGWCGQNGTSGWGGSGRPFGFDVAPNNPDRVIFGGWGFVHKTTNGGALWQQAYVDVADQHPANVPTPKNKTYHSIGFENTSCWQIHWIDANNMWSCFTDLTGIRSQDAGKSWSFANNTSATNNGGETYRVVQHPANGTLFAARASIHDIYQETYLEDAKLDLSDSDGKIIFSTDNGLNWKVLKLFNHPVFWIALDPNNPNKAFASVVHYTGGAGIGGIYMTNDLQNLTSATWTLLPDPPRTQKHPASITVLNDGKMVCSYSARADYSTGPNGGTYWASSGVFIYDTNTNSWSDVSDPGMYYYTKDIVVDPNDAAQNTWYACVFSGGWGSNPASNKGGLYKTTNRGATWTKILTDKNVESCTFNPNNANQLYVTTAINGLWVSNNINSVTPTFSNVPAYNFWHPMRIFFNPFDNDEMWVSSFGNGMKVGKMNTVGISERKKSKTFSIFPNPANESLTIQINGIIEKQQIQVFNSIGELMKEFEITQSTHVNITELPKGFYLVQLKGFPGQSQKFIKQ
jgi:hypothetical protein